MTQPAPQCPHPFCSACYPANPCRPECRICHPASPDGLTLPCGCAYTPGIDLPTIECPQHADDPALAHRTPPPCAHRACGRPWDEHTFGIFCP